MGLANSIISFFDVRSSPIVNGHHQIKTMKDFIDETREDLFQSIKTANKLVELGYMLFAGTNGNNPLAGNKYITMISNSKYDRYGAYDNEIFGFNQIRIKHSENVLPIVVKKTKDFDIGTGFTFQMGKLKCIATAKHCITDMSKVIISLSGINIIPTAIVTSTNHNIDIAVIFLDEETQALIQNPFEFEKSDILDNVLTMGYPELPGFDALLVSEISQVNSIQKNSIGNIVDRKSVV